MKTILVFVVALVLGALLAYFLGPLVSPPAEEPAESPRAETTLPPDTHEAAVVVEVDENGECKPKTFPQILCARAKDRVVWTVVAAEPCAAFRADLQVEVKPPAEPRDLEFEEETRGPQRAAKIPKVPDRCEDQRPCPIPYKVTVTDGERSLVEDPRIDIW